jgi:acyl-CoA thioester hydrolase
MISHKTLFRVRYVDTDQMQFMHHARYLEYFEAARTEMLRSYGLPYNEVEKSGFQLPLVEAGLKYIRPAFYDDLLEIEASVKELYSPKVHIYYSVRRKGDEKLLVEGFTLHAFISVETKKAVRPPKFYIDKLAEHFKK